MIAIAVTLVLVFGLPVRKPPPRKERKTVRRCPHCGMGI